MLNYVSSEDAIFGRFNTDWTDGRLATLLGYQPALYFRGREEPTKPDFAFLWARISTQTVASPQTSFSSCVETLTKRRFTTYGLTFVQLFCPQKGNGYEIGKQVAQVCVDAFRAKSGGDNAGRVIFNNTRVRELDPEASSYRFNVVTEHQYDELG